MKTKNYRLHRSPESKGRKPLVLSISKLAVLAQCPRCFWFLVRRLLEPPHDYPPGILTRKNIEIRKVYDKWRHPLRGGLPKVLQKKVPGKLVEQKVADLFRQGLQCTAHPHNIVLRGRFDDCVFISRKSSYLPLKNRFPSSVRREVGPLDRLKLDLLTLLLARRGYKTENRGVIVEYYFATSIPQRHWWTHSVKIVRTSPRRAIRFIGKAARVARLSRPPRSSPACELCTYVKRRG